MPPAPPVAKAPPPPAPRTPPTAPDLRLPDTVRPVENKVDLTLDPASEDVKGTITTTLDVTQPTDVIWLNGDEITITSAKAIVGQQALTPQVLTPKKGYLGLWFDHELPAGRVGLSLAYTAKAHVDDGDGIYRTKEGDAWYAFTQFESTDARQAFPTFDEPSFKVPWQLTLHVPKGLVALSNTPVESEHDDPDGLHAVTFKETKPLPSYLVAFCVGPFDLVDAGKTKEGVPLRVVTPKGRGAEAAYAAKITADLLDREEAYFGSPYPYEKLDLVAVPVFNAGAMENAGLITFRLGRILVKPAEMDEDWQQGYAETVAHEMAHQWFGDLVTLGWWDDTWLNESFASWMETKIVAAWQPKWDLDVDAVSSKSGIMGADSLDTARAIHQPIVTQADIESSFDGITYQKGEAVLRMIERFVGPDTFQKGVRAYLAKHAWGNATYDDFVGAMSDAAGRDLSALFDSFVKQSGVPLVTMDLACKTGAPPTLGLAQRRYAPIGSKIDPHRTWSIPVCVRWGAGSATGRDCTVLSAASGELALSAKTCPAWVLPNEGELGYYRSKLEGHELDHLLAHARKLALGERVGLIGDVQALVASGDVPTATALGLVSELAKDRSRHLVDASIGIVAGIRELVPDTLRPNYQRFVKRLFGARAHELGWTPRKGESDDAKQLRPELLGLVADEGGDKALIAEATKLAYKWLDDHKSVAPEVAHTALLVAARHGDQKLFDRIHAAAKAAKDADKAGMLLGALGSFEDPKLSQAALAIVLTDEFELRESAGILRAAMSDPKLREATYQFAKQHFDEIEAKLPLPFRRYMAYFANPLCDDSRIPELEAFLGPRMAKVGGERDLAQAMESISLCAAGRKARAASVAAFLAKQ